VPGLGAEHPGAYDGDLVGGHAGEVRVDSALVHVLRLGITRTGAESEQVVGVGAGEVERLSVDTEPDAASLHER
jgi:hypothetical protein